MDHAYHDSACLAAQSYNDSKKHKTLGEDITETLIPSSKRFPGYLQFATQNWKLQILLIIGCSIALLVFIQRSFASVLLYRRAMPDVHRRDSTVKTGGIEMSTLSVMRPISGVLEVFQVYQPVLAPNGLMDEIILKDGSSSPTKMEPLEHTLGCGELLMEHSFGFSYGHPFVGRLAVICCTR